jgi:integrase
LKYDVLDPFKKYLYQNLSKNTARKYYSSAVKLFENFQFNSITEINKKAIEEEIAKFKTKNEFSAAKNSMLKMKKFYPDLDIPEEEIFKEISRKKRNWSKKPKKNIYLDETKRKINQMKNVKLKLAFRLALVSGLRVSELSFLEARDIAFEDEIITVNVRHGKGGSNGYVKCLPDPYLYKKLKEYTDAKEPGERLFYSEAYMREKADRLELECHDFRRICAITYRNQLKKEMPISEADIKVQEQLRHKRFSTTKRYLYNRKLIVQKTKGENDAGKTKKKEK